MTKSVAKTMTMASNYKQAGNSNTNKITERPDVKKEPRTVRTQKSLSMITVNCRGQGRFAHALGCTHSEQTEQTVGRQLEEIPK